MNSQVCLRAPSAALAAAALCRVPRRAVTVKAYHAGGHSHADQKRVSAPALLAGIAAAAQLLVLPPGPALAESTAGIQIADVVEEEKQLVMELKQTADHLASALQSVGIEVEVAENFAEPQEAVGDIAEAHHAAEESSLAPQEPVGTIAEAESIADSIAEPQDPTAVVAEAEPPAAGSTPKPQEPVATIAEGQQGPDSIPEPQESVGTIADAGDAIASLEEEVVQVEAILGAAGSTEPTEVVAAVEQQLEVIEVQTAAFAQAEAKAVPAAQRISEAVGVQEQLAAVEPALENL